MLVFGTTAAEASQWNENDGDGASTSGGLFGLLVCITTLVLTSAAAVSCEYAYKSTSHVSLLQQNVVLYSYV